MKYKLRVPVTIGDLLNPITIDEFEFHSISLTFDPERPVLSMVLEHKASGWKHAVTYVDSSAAEFWARTMEAPIDAIVKAAIEKLVADNKLPAGSYA